MTLAHGSGQKVSKISWVESGWLRRCSKSYGAGHEVFTYHGPGRVALTRPDKPRSELTREKPWQKGAFGTTQTYQVHGCCTCCCTFRSNVNIKIPSPKFKINKSTEHTFVSSRKQKNSYKIGVKFAAPTLIQMKSPD